jgi:hypothetical protein
MIARQHNLELAGHLMQDRLTSLIDQLSVHQQIVLLVDEYDHPLLKQVNNVEIARANREILKSFYECIKGLSKHFRAIFITGVTKFAKTSIFSGMNNLVDLSMAQEGAELLGYTHDELRTYFDDYLTAFAVQQHSSVDDVLVQFREWYDGYLFCRDNNAARLYNPYSILYALHEKEYRNYWFESGTPSFLMHLIQAQYYTLRDVQDMSLSAESLGSFELDNIPLIALLYQTGYLTIKEYDAATKKIHLDYPNIEIRESFQKFLVIALANSNQASIDLALTRLVKALDNDDIDIFCQTLQAVFAHIPYQLHVPLEGYYHSLLQLLGTLLAFELQSEVVTDKGSIDLVVTTKNHIYIFELKLNDTPQKAIVQILKKKYYERYLPYKKPIVLVGLAFNTDKQKLNITYARKDLA